MLRSSEVSSPKCPLSTFFQALPGGRVSTQEPGCLQPSPIFGSKTRPVPLCPAAREEAVPNRRGFIPGEAPGHTAAGNSLLEGEATHICLCITVGCPSPLVLPRAGQGAVSQGTALPRGLTGRVWLPTADHGAGAQPRGPGHARGGHERGAELRHWLQEHPSPRQALAGPRHNVIRAGRFPAGFCIRPLVPQWHLCQHVLCPLAGTAPVSPNCLPGATCRRRLWDLPFSGTAEIRLLREGTFQGNLA